MAPGSTLHAADPVKPRASSMSGARQALARRDSCARCGKSHKPRESVRPLRPPRSPYAYGPLCTRGRGPRAFRRLGRHAWQTSRHYDRTFLSRTVSIVHGANRCQPRFGGLVGVASADEEPGMPRLWISKWGDVAAAWFSGGRNGVVHAQIGPGPQHPGSITSPSVILIIVIWRLTERH
jgi:hypothetical protein